MKKIAYRNKKGKTFTNLSIYISSGSFERYKELSQEMGISMSELSEKLINNFYKFRDINSK